MVTTRLNAQLAPLSVCETGLNLGGGGGGGGGQGGSGQRGPFAKILPPLGLTKKICVQCAGEVKQPNFSLSLGSQRSTFFHLLLNLTLHVCYYQITKNTQERVARVRACNSVKVGINGQY